ncbi:restriction endonuclease subunit S [Escherichia coli]
MGSKWKSIVLNDLINQGHAFLQTGPFGTALKAEEYSDNGVPLISVREIRNGYIKIEGTTPRVSRHTTSRLPKFVLNKGDIVFARKGGVDRTAYITEKEAGWFLGSDGIYLRLDDNYNSLFISYIMRSPTTREWLIKNSEGTTMPSLNQKILSRIPLTIPDLYKQKIIANFLYSLDKKININNQLNHTLEQMSQTLFKSWFVDFDPVIDNALDAGNPTPEAMQSRVELRQKVRNSADFKPLPAEIRSLFPSEFEETELGWVPKSWNISLAGEEFIVKGGSTPSTANEDFWINGTIYWTSPKDLTGNQSKVLLDTAKKITPLGLTKISSGLLPVNTVLMSSRAPIGYLAINKVPMAINQGYIAIPSAKHLSPEFTIYWLENIMDDIKGIAGGTTFAEISKSAFKTIKLLIPSSDIITEFSRVTRNHFDKVVQNTKEIDLLTNLRDTLLPKLISGELSLEDLPDLTTDTEAA